MNGVIEEHPSNEEEELEDHSYDRYLQERLIELHKQVNINELTKILEGITKMHSKSQKTMLPNIETNKRFHLSYKQLNLRQ